MLASHTLDPTATLPARFIRAPVDAYIPDLVGAVDCVLGMTFRLATYVVQTRHCLCIPHGHDSCYAVRDACVLPPSNPQR